MIQWLKSLDRIFRGEVTRPDALQDGSIDIPAGGLTLVIVFLAMTYGLCMGSYSAFREVDPNIMVDSDRYMQVVSSVVKVPALYLLTLLVTFPSLYVFNALVGSRLKLVAMLRLLIASLAVNLAVLASLGPIVAFFSVSTTSYRFMQLFNVIVFAGAGLLGLKFLVQSLNRMSRPVIDWRSIQPSADPPPVLASVASDGQSPSDDTVEPTKQTASQSPGALDPIAGIGISSQVTLVFRIWMVVFGLVGAQMGWVLRPLIGNPNQPFTWFRDRDSNFFQALMRILTQLLQGS